jgi:hypothetical protein
MFPTNVSAIKERTKAGRMTGKRKRSVSREKVRGVKVEGTKQREGNGGGSRTIGCTRRKTQRSVEWPILPLSSVMRLRTDSGFNWGNGSVSESTKQKKLESSCSF